MPTICGIDPGLSGAIAVMEDRHGNCDPGPMKVASLPMVKLDKTREELDVVTLDRWLDLFPPIDLAVIEKVWADPHFGSASSFTFGKTYGMLLTILAVRGIPTIRVTPQKWKKEILTGTKKDKEAAIAFVRGLWPNLDINIKGKPSHDIAEAVCLAEYGRRQQQKGVSCS